MKFQQVMAFFLTGATALSISTTALAADLPDNVDTTVSATQTADEQENNLYTRLGLYPVFYRWHNFLL